MSRLVSFKVRFDVSLRFDASVDHTETRKVWLTFAPPVLAGDGGYVRQRCCTSQRGLRASSNSCRNRLMGLRMTLWAWLVLPCEVYSITRRR